MHWRTYCGWYLHYIREPWGALPSHYYLSRIMWALLVPVLKKTPPIEELAYKLVTDKPEEEEIMSDDQIKAGMMRFGGGKVEENG